VGSVLKLSLVAKQRQLSREATSAYSRGRQPTELWQESIHSREAAAASDTWLNCCRRFAAMEREVLSVCGLTPTAICCRGFAAKDEIASLVEQKNYI